MATLNDLAFLLTLLKSGGCLEKGKIQNLVSLARGKGVPFTFRFVDYFYGPHSSELSNFIEFLVGLGLVEEKSEATPPRGFRFNYCLTEKGEKMLERVLEKVDQTHVENLKKIVEGAPAGTAHACLGGLVLRKYS